MIFTNAISIFFAYIIDLIIGDPKTWPHPVKAIGKIISYLDEKLNHNKRIEGVWMLLIVLTFVTLSSVSIIVLAYRIHLLFGIFIESIMIATTISQKGLKDAALEVYQPLLEKKLPDARDKLSHIVGRDTVGLNESEITRATVETVAENTTDGITAPIFWAIFAGGPGALIYRAINTCDSMVGYKNRQYEDFGWASAKLDDLVNWIPARLTALLMLYSTKANSRAGNLSVKKLSEEAMHHVSPNSGWTEAAIAILLGVELGGSNYYKGIRSESTKIGEGNRELESKDIMRTIRTMQTTSFLFMLITILGVGIYAFTKTWI